MALMTCPDCANQYPDDAPYCPNCGRPNPARQAGATGASAGAAPGAGQPETPAGAGPSSTTYTAGTGSAAGAGSSGGYPGGTGSTGAPGGGYSGATGGAYAGGPGDIPPAGGGYGGAAGGGYTGGGYTGGGGGGYTGGGGAEYAGGVPPQQIPNYMVQSILVTLFTCFTCCIPIGGIALFFSTQVNSKRDAGDIQGALAASKNAKLWCWITLGVALAWLVIGMIFGILSAILGAVAEQAG